MPFFSLRLASFCDFYLIFHVKLPVTGFANRVPQSRIFQRFQIGCWLFLGWLTPRKHTTVRKKGDPKVAPWLIQALPGSVIRTLVFLRDALGAVTSGAGLGSGCGAATPFAFGEPMPSFASAVM